MPSKEMKTLELVDRINLLLSETRAIPFTNKVPLDKEELSDLLKRLEESLPEDIRQAQEINDQKQEILNSSRQQAEQAVREANQTARTTVDNAADQAKATLTDAQKKATQTLQEATDSANAMIADAQNRANMIVQNAQNHAQQLVSESEIVARAQTEAQEIMDATHRECEAYSMRVHSAVSQMLENADINLTQQVDQLRALRQSISVNQYGETVE